MQERTRREAFHVDVRDVDSRGESKAGRGIRRQTPSKNKDMTSRPPRRRSLPKCRGQRVPPESFQFFQLVMAPTISKSLSILFERLKRMEHLLNLSSILSAVNKRAASA